MFKTRSNFVVIFLIIASVSFFSFSYLYSKKQTIQFQGWKTNKNSSQEFQPKFILDEDELPDYSILMTEPTISSRNLLKLDPLSFRRFTVQVTLQKGVVPPTFVHVKFLNGNKSSLPRLLSPTCKENYTFSYSEEVEVPERNGIYDVIVEYDEKKKQTSIVTNPHRKVFFEGKIHVGKN